MANKKKYKCPYCDARMYRERLIIHVADKHEEMIPQEFTPRRVVFNSINHKDGGRCVICGKPSRWIEESGHYDRYCSKACRTKAREKYKENILRVRGTTNLLEDPEVQTKMLAGRSISGEYKFTDGGIRSYTGSYEAKLLEFADKALNIPSEYIETPGPILEYQYNGKKHNWVTDQYWWPWNLIIEVKDGGKNPNKKPMEDSRSRQLCKELMITDKGTYNYLRLTDNQFPQLIELLLEIKQENMNGGAIQPIIKIYENTLIESASERLINKHPKQDLRMQSGVYFISYSFVNDIDDESIEGFAIADDLIPSKLLRIKENKIVVEDGSFLDNRKVTVYKYLGDKTIRDIITTKEVGEDYFYTALTGNKMFIAEQPLLDYQNFDMVDFSLYKYIKESYDATMWDEFNQVVNKRFVLPVVSITEKAKADLITNGVSNITILEDMDGYFVYNDILQQRSKSYVSVSDIPKKVVKLISSQNIRESVYNAYTDLLLLNDAK